MSRTDTKTAPPTGGLNEKIELDAPVPFPEEVDSSDEWRSLSQESDLDPSLNCPVCSSPNACAHGQWRGGKAEQESHRPLSRAAFVEKHMENWEPERHPEARAAMVSELGRAFDHPGCVTHNITHHDFSARSAPCQDMGVLPQAFCGHMSVATETPTRNYVAYERVIVEHMLPYVAGRYPVCLTAEEATETGSTHGVDFLANRIDLDRKHSQTQPQGGGGGGRKQFRVGVLLSGGPASGGHNVIAGVYDGIKSLFDGAEVYGFLGGVDGLLQKRYRVLTDEDIDSARNTGGFSLLSSGRGKIRPGVDEADAVRIIEELGLEGLVVIGGDGSNTNAAVLANALGRVEGDVRPLFNPLRYRDDHRFDSTTDSTRTTTMEPADPLFKQTLDVAHGKVGVEVLSQNLPEVSLDLIEAARLHTDPVTGLVAPGVRASKNLGFQTRARCSVIGVPKTIDGDLRSEVMPICFGFDTAVRVYAGEVSALAQQAVAENVWHFVRVMGRSASHLVAELALRTQPNVVFLGERVEDEAMCLEDIVQEIVSCITERHLRGLEYGVVLIPEGLIGFIPEIRDLLEDIATNLNKLKPEESAAIACAKDFDHTCLTPASRRVWESLPLHTRDQLMYARENTGYPQVSRVEIEWLISDMVKAKFEATRNVGQLAARKWWPNNSCWRASVGPPPSVCDLSHTREAGAEAVDGEAVLEEDWKGPYILHHYLGYEGRSAPPSRFDAAYCYALGMTAGYLAAHRANGFMATIENPGEPVREWKPRGVPFVDMMHWAELPGNRRTPAIARQNYKANSPEYEALRQQEEGWRVAAWYPSAEPSGCPTHHGILDQRKRANSSATAHACADKEDACLAPDNYVLHPDQPLGVFSDNSTHEACHAHALDAAIGDTPVCGGPPTAGYWNVKRYFKCCGGLDFYDPHAAIEDALCQASVEFVKSVAVVPCNINSDAYLEVLRSFEKRRNSGAFEGELHYYLGGIRDLMAGRFVRELPQGLATGWVRDNRSDLFEIDEAELEALAQRIEYDRVVLVGEARYGELGRLMKQANKTLVCIPVSSYKQTPMRGGEQEEGSSAQAFHCREQRRLSTCAFSTSGLSTQAFSTSALAASALSACASQQHTRPLGYHSALAVADNLVGNLVTDVQSMRKYWHIVRVGSRDHTVDICRLNRNVFSFTNKVTHALHNLGNNMEYQTASFETVVRAWHTSNDWQEDFGVAVLDFSITQRFPLYRQFFDDCTRFRTASPECKDLAQLRQAVNTAVLDSMPVNLQNQLLTIPPNRYSLDFPLEKWIEAIIEQVTNGKVKTVSHSFVHATTTLPLLNKEHHKLQALTLAALTHSGTRP